MLPQLFVPGMPPGMDPRFLAAHHYQQMQQPGWSSASPLEHPIEPLFSAEESESPKKKHGSSSKKHGKSSSGCAPCRGSEEYSLSPRKSPSGAYQPPPKVKKQLDELHRKNQTVAPVAAVDTTRRRPSKQSESSSTPKANGRGTNHRSSASQSPSKSKKEETRERHHHGGSKAPPRRHSVKGRLQEMQGSPSDDEDNHISHSASSRQHSAEEFSVGNGAWSLDGRSMEAVVVQEKMGQRLPQVSHYGSHSALPPGPSPSYTSLPQLPQGSRTGAGAAGGAVEPAPTQPTAPPNFFSCFDPNRTEVPIGNPPLPPQTSRAAPPATSLMAINGGEALHQEGEAAVNPQLLACQHQNPQQQQSTAIASAPVSNGYQKEHRNAAPVSEETPLLKQNSVQTTASFQSESYTAGSLYDFDLIMTQQKQQLQEAKMDPTAPAQASSREKKDGNGSSDVTRASPDPYNLLIDLPPIKSNVEIFFDEYTINS